MKFMVLILCVAAALGQAAHADTGLVPGGVKVDGFKI
jgi:hypothetical protein